MGEHVLRKTIDASLTELSKSLLVALAVNDLLLLGLRFLCNLLDGSDPAVALSWSLSIKLVLVTVQLERELASAALLDLFSISLTKVLVMICIHHFCLEIITHQVLCTAWCSLVLAMLVEEEQALSGLASPGSGRARGVFALGQVCLELG